MSSMHVEYIYKIGSLYYSYRWLIYKKISIYIPTAESNDVYVWKQNMKC